MTAQPLDDFDLGILRFSELWWHSPSAREVAIAEQFGLTPIRFYQRLNALLDDPAANAAEPALCSRLRRIRERRRSQIRARTTSDQERTDP